MSNRLNEILKPKWEREPAPSGRVRLSNFEIDMPDLRKLWGNDIVDNRLADGTIKIMEEPQDMPEDIKQKYDFEFICLSFNLISIYGGKGAIAPNAITAIEHLEDSDSWRMTIHGGDVYNLSHPQMAELEQAIKTRQEDAKILKRENYKAELLMQFEVNQELLAEANRVAPVPGHIFDPRIRRH